MFRFRFLNYLVAGSLIVVCTACSSEEPKGEIIFVDSSDRMASQEINDEPPQLPVNLPAYDGTIQTARKQVDEIMDAIKNMRVTQYNYLYDNNSGEGESQGDLYFSSDNDMMGKGKDWCLKLNKNNYTIEYFFNEKQDLFAIRQWHYNGKSKLIAEIFYKEEEGVINGSWIQRTNDDKVDLASYTGDFWYDFLEGYPMYSTVSGMKADTCLKYQQ